MISPCQCEHISHFAPCTDHHYGQCFDSKTLTQVPTPYGKFNVCESCKDKHFVSSPKAA